MGLEQYTIDRARVAFDRRGNMAGLLDGAGRIIQPEKSLANRLMASSSRARGANGVDIAGAMPTPPTVTVNADVSGLSLTSSTKYRPATGRDRFRIRGTGGAAFEAVTADYITAKGERTSAGGAIAYDANGWEATFGTDSRYVLFGLVGSASKSYRVFVLDKSGGVNSGWVSLAGHNIGASNATLLLDFGAAGDREITLVSKQDLGLRQVQVEESASLWAPVRDEVRVLIKGDSYTWGTMSPQPAYGGTTMGSVVRSLLGCDVVCQGIGGSGYVAANAITNAYRLDDAVSVGADLGVLALGTNDVGVSSGQALRDAVTAALSGIRGRGCVHPWIVGYVWPQNRMSAGASTNKTNLLQVEADIGQAVAEFADPGIVFVPINTVGAALPWGGVCQPWIEGTQDTATAGGDAGNSRRVIGDDHAHPSAFGSIYLGRRMADDIIRAAVVMGW